jgi:aldehyde dehydrogenase
VSLCVFRALQASVIRAEESSIAELDSQTVTIALSEPLGVIAQIIPWNFPICGDLETGSGISCRKYSSSKAESTPISILVLMELIGDILPQEL